jgi:hypothetical protein
VTYTEPVAVEQDEVGMQLDNGQTYGVIAPAGGATFARVSSDRPLGRLTVLALAEDGTSVQKTPVPGRPAGAADAVHSRRDWGADESLRFRGPNVVWPPVFQTVQKLVVHHTAGANGETGETAKATIRSIYYYHAVTQGWGDIGYNFLIDADGVVYKGRSTSSTATDGDVTGENALHQGVTAGHAYGYNSGSVGIALLGNFVGTVPGPAADAAVKNLLISKVSAHGLNAHLVSPYTNPLNGSQVSFENVPGHSEVPDNATECPGGALLARLRYMRDEVYYAATEPDVSKPTSPSSVKAVANKRTVNLSWPADSLDGGSVSTGGVPGGISGVAGYDVYRGSTLLGRTAALTFTDSTLTRGTTYTVQTYDGAGNRSASPRSVLFTG